MENTEEKCTHNCSSCQSSCSSKEDDQKSFFDAMSEFADKFTSDEGMDVVDALLKEFDK